MCAIGLCKSMYAVMLHYSMHVMRLCMPVLSNVIAGPLVRSSVRVIQIHTDKHLNTVYMPWYDVTCHATFQLSVRHISRRARHSVSLVGAVDGQRQGVRGLVGKLVDRLRPLGSRPIRITLLFQCCFPADNAAKGVFE